MRAPRRARAVRTARRARDGGAFGFGLLAGAVFFATFFTDFFFGAFFATFGALLALGLAADRALERAAGFAGCLCSQVLEA